jgi:hypothetical protein
MSVERTVWGYAEEESPEGWHGTFATKEEAIAEGRKDFGKDVDFWVISGKQPSPADFILLITGDTAEMLGDEICDVANDEGYNTDNGVLIPAEAEVELKSLLRAWAEKHIEVDFWASNGSTAEHVLAEEGQG